MGRHLIDLVDVHALAEQPGRSLKIFRRGGGVGERTRVSVNAQPQQRGLVATQTDVLRLEVLDQQAGHRAHLGQMHRIRRDIVRRVGVVIPGFDAYAGSLQQGSHMPHAAALAGVHQYQPIEILPAQVGGLGKAIGGGVQVGVYFLQATLLAAREKQHAGRIEMPRGQHGRKGVEVGIGVTGDQSGRSGAHSWLRGWN